MLALLINARIAGAICVLEGKVSRLRSGSPGNVVDVQQISNIPSFANFYVVPTNRFYSMLAAAQAGNLTVFVTGDAASCPTAGTFRFGANVIGVDVFRNL